MIVADARQRRSPRRLPGARMKRAATSDSVDGGAWNAAAPLCATREQIVFTTLFTTRKSVAAAGARSGFSRIEVPPISPGSVPCFHSPPSPAFQD